MAYDELLESYQLIPPALLTKLGHLGIRTRQDLRRKGSLRTYLEIKSRHLGLTHSFLWRLYAIEQGMQIGQISLDIKHQLRKELKTLTITKSFPMQAEMEYYMSLALLEAKKADAAQEVPVGALVVLAGKVIGTGYNQCIAGHYIGNHAELLAIKEASQNLQNYRLENCDLYVTLEPCMMCTGAIIQARIARVVYGVREEKTGMVDSFNSDYYAYMNRHTSFQGGILQQECKKLLSDFFLSKR